MKKTFFAIIFLLTLPFVFCEDLTGFEDIDFGIKKTSVIALMENKGYSASFPTANSVSFTKDGEYFCDVKVKEYRFYFKDWDNSFCSFALVLDVSDNNKYSRNIPKYLKEKYPVIKTEALGNDAIFCYKMDIQSSTKDKKTIFATDSFLGDYIIKFYCGEFFFNLEVF